MPDEISPIGYDDIDFAAAAAVPLSSNSAASARAGCSGCGTAAEIEALENDAPHEHQHVLLDLVECAGRR